MFVSGKLRGQYSPGPIELYGNWIKGYALEYHTESSKPITDENGKITGWDTKRPEIAEELYRLKYWRELWRVKAIAQPASNFLSKFKSSWQLDLIMPIPPSNDDRDFQPVFELAKVIGQLCNLSIDLKNLKKIKSTPQLKEIEDEDERVKIMKEAFDTTPYSLNGKNVLLFDDLYRSGATLKAVTSILLEKGKAKGIYVLTITKTRSKR